MPTAPANRLFDQIEIVDGCRMVSHKRSAMRHMKYQRDVRRKIKVQGFVLALHRFSTRTVPPRAFCILSKDGTLGTMNTTIPGASAATITGPLMIGSRGKDVQTLQSLLNRATVPSPGLAADGSFGTKTDTALRAFQQRNGLKPDGIAGPLTARALGVQFVPQRQPLPTPSLPGNVPPTSTVTPVAVLMGVVAKELKQIARTIESSFNNGFDERPEVFNRAIKFLKSGLNQALSRLASAAQGGPAADLAAHEVGSALLQMAGGLGVVAEELGKGGADTSIVTSIRNELSARIPRVMDVVKNTLAGQLEGGVRTGVTLLRDLLGPLSN